MKPQLTVPSDMVEAQLDRIMTSSGFCHAPRLQRFLSYVVGEYLAGRTDRLKGYTIGLEVFDKSDNFDPQSDTIVRVQARALRQKLEHYYTHDGAADPVVITIPKGTYEPEFAVAAEAGVTAPAAVPGKPSIAVLPFDDFSEVFPHTAFSDGLTEEVIANLSRFSELAVFSRSTTRKAKLDNLSIGQMYQSFRPDFVLEGSCRISPQEVMITINLVVAASDEVILTRHCNRALTPDAIYEVQDEMALLIAEQIADRFGPLDQYARRAARSGLSLKWETFRWISEYHKYTLQLSQGDRTQIREGLARALEADPSSSDACAALALVTLDDYRVSLSGRPVTAALDRSLEIAEEAVRLDPQNACALEALALANFHRGAFDRFDQLATQALAFNPGHGGMLAMIGVCYAARMDWDKAMPLLDRAIALNPLQPGWFHIPKAIGLMMAGQRQAAVAEMYISPLNGVAFYHCHLAWFLSETNDMEGALAQKAVLIALLPDFEDVVVAHCRAWCIDDAILHRALAGWQRLGLNVCIDADQCPQTIME